MELMRENIARMLVYCLFLTCIYMNKQIKSFFYWFLCGSVVAAPSINMDKIKVDGYRKDIR